MKFKIVHITGARPHFMKLAPVYHTAASRTNIEQVVVHTGQHYDDSLFGSFLREFELPEPDYNLRVGSAQHSIQIGQMLIGLAPVLEEVQPDIVFVYGDTNSTAAGAIASAKSNIPVAHIEAGLREFDKRIPEEVNKLITDAISDLYYCPTASAVQNLKNSGITGNVFFVGDVVVDLIMQAKQDNPGMFNGDYAVVTCHRAANTDDPKRLKGILSALQQLGERVLFPVHPRTRKAIDDAGLGDLLSAAEIDIMEPCGFWEMQSLIRDASVVLTDSGGVIREAYVHRTPCVILDDQTEWNESVNEGWAVIAGAATEKILAGISEVKGFNGPQSGFLGDGNASERIIDTALDYLVKNAVK